MLKKVQLYFMKRERTRTFKSPDYGTNETPAFDWGEGLPSLLCTLDIICQQAN